MISVIEHKYYIIPKLQHHKIENPEMKLKTLFFCWLYFEPKKLYYEMEVSNRVSE